MVRPVTRKTGLELDSFFDEWLYQAGRPAACDE
jgi:hypothetical protein